MGVAGDRGVGGPVPPDRVVVGVDGSGPSRAALAHALVAAARRGGRVEIVTCYVVELHQLGGVPVVLPDLAGTREDAAARARALVDELRGDGSLAHVPGLPEVEVVVSAVPGPAAQALVDRSRDADLLVVGSRGRGGARSALLGSVALHCATHAACPVVVVHAGAGSDRMRVVVGDDGSPGARAALVAAVDEGARAGTDVEVVVAYAIEDFWLDLTTVVVPPTQQIRDELRDRTERTVAGILADRAAAGRPVPAVRTSVVPGHAADVLVDRAGADGLLVVGSRGGGMLRGLLLGSVALHCAIHAPGAVMVVHPREERGGPHPPATRAPEEGRPAPSVPA
ncbi:universal stress protein [Blastococcus sp. VKM Ac-2987]|uniref:universal stress protein n=1 Tax=Blastococcus sp. VKM Ac-2987 TaxID=3004141 RepID=UPI0022AB6A17|nr:universal stress protein [Blastococcus sp. VKM Ac-2987]MCZ2860599.1 universal stress protein [Blastococcus sp. VKM Ac-2987]